MSHDSVQRARRVVVVGGGFSAATFAVQLIRNAEVPLEISIVEPREQIGRGLAYSAQDKDHRLNGPADSHSLDPEQPDEFLKWCLEKRLPELDPECVTPSGLMFIRRRDYGSYVVQQLSRYAKCGAGCSRIRHVRDKADNASFDGSTYRVATSESGVLVADLLVVATGNPQPALRLPFEPQHHQHPRIIANPLNPGCLRHVGVEDRVLVVGTGLTAFDVLSTLLRSGHTGEMFAISRRGLQPRSQRPEVFQPPQYPARSGAYALESEPPLPEFLDVDRPFVRQWLHALRVEVRRLEQEGRCWHDAVDAVRNSAGRLWLLLSLTEQQRFLRKLSIWYDVHRFRLPPMNELFVRKAEDDGKVRFEAARLVKVQLGSESPILVDIRKGAAGATVGLPFDWVVNCTGLDHAKASSDNPFLQSLLTSGLLKLHPNGLGFDVSPQCEALSVTNAVQSGLRVFGPPTAGAFGDPLGAAFIASQVRRVMPDVLRYLQASPSPL